MNTESLKSMQVTIINVKKNPYFKYSIYIIEEYC